MRLGRASRHQKTKKGRESRSARLDSALDAIKAALKSPTPKRARRLITGGHRKRLWPPAARRVDWWREALGPANFQRLTRLLASADCLHCEGGIVRCQACRGKGMIDGTPCEACAALGVAPCGFCGGSGYAVLDDFPIGLRKAAMSHRLAVAMERITQDTDTGRGNASSQHRLRHAQEIVRLNRLQTVVNNALELLRLLSRERDSDASIPADAAKAMLRQCRTAALQVDERLRSALKHLGDEEHHRAASRAGASREHAARRAEYFHQLAKSKTFGDTPLNRKGVRALFTIYAPAARSPESS